MTPRGTFAKNDSTRRISTSSGKTISPLMPCSANPPSPVNAVVSLSMAALSNTPPLWIQVPRPKMA